MNNKEAIDDLKNFRAGLGAGCHLPIGERGLEIQRTHIHAISQAIKALEVVEKIKREAVDDSRKDYEHMNAVYTALNDTYGKDWKKEYKEAENE